MEAQLQVSFLISFFHILYYFFFHIILNYKIYDHLAYIMAYLNYLKFILKNPKTH